MPPEATAHLVRARYIVDVPVLCLTLSSERYSSYELRRIAAEVKREIASIGDISDVRLTGGERRQVTVELDDAGHVRRMRDWASAQVVGIDSTHEPERAPSVAGE